MVDERHVNKKRDDPKGYILNRNYFDSYLAFQKGRFLSI